MARQIFIFIIGTICGSFLNVCIHRLPKGEGVVFGRSRCPHCASVIAWYDNIPLVSYLILRGRCRTCRGVISFRYFLVELLSGLSFLFCFRAFGLGFDLVFYLILISGLTIATFVDIEHRIIPDEVTLGGIAAGFILNWLKTYFSTGNFLLQPLRDSFIGAAVGGGIIFLVGFLFDTVYFKLLKKPAVEGETTSMGGGDVKLLAMIGAFLGWQKAVLVFFLAPFLGLSLGIINLIVKRRHVLPYGPFLSLASVIAAFWADRIFALFFLR